MENLVRFIKAQDKVYPKVLKELKRGKKTTHWMWYIFPQLKILGQSETAKYYGITDAKEAKAFIENEILKNRYYECCNILLALEDNDIYQILGDIDGMKLKSSLTLFYFVTKDKLFYELLKKHYNGDIDKLTWDYLDKNIK